MPYPTLLGIDWAFKNQAIINLKKKTMSFKGNGIRAIGLLDPELGPRYTELVTAEEEAHNIDTIYKLTAMQADYVKPTDDGMLSQRCERSCVSDSEVGLENWQLCLHEVSRRRLARITKSLCWIGSEVSTIPTFDGLSDIQTFVKEYEAQVPYSKRLSSLLVALRATPTRWWTAHQRQITTSETCHRLLTARFGIDTGGMDSLYDGLTYLAPHVQAYEEAWKNRATDEWVHLFVHTLDSNPRHWYMETELRHGTESWYILRENLYLTFDQSQYSLVDDSLELIHMKIVEDPSPICTQLDWTSQIENASECYNFTIDEDDNPRNINISESEGLCTVVGPTPKCLEIIKKLKIKKVNIRTEETLKIVSIGNYWDDKTIGQVVDLLQEYQDLFPTKFQDMKGILRGLGVMRIPLKEGVKPVKHHSYRLNPKYKEKVRKELCSDNSPNFTT